MNCTALDSIARFVHQRSRLCFSGHRRSVLKNRLEGRLAQLSLPDLAAYQSYLGSSSGEEEILLDLLTTNETSFFRNWVQFRYLMEKIVPEIELKRGKEVLRSWGRNPRNQSGSVMKLRILCAGCSTGEEPYSVAMALLESLRYPKAWDIEILAGDISASCVRTAMSGCYDVDRLKGIPHDYLNRYATREGGGVTFTAEVKSLIRFCTLNLNDVMDGGGFPGMTGGRAAFDIIFCRNVMIYFSPESQQQLVDVLHNHLVPGGYLFTGDAEPLHLYEHDFMAVRDAGCLVYKKTEPTNARAV